MKIHLKFMVRAVYEVIHLNSASFFLKNNYQFELILYNNFGVLMMGKCRKNKTKMTKRERGRESSSRSLCRRSTKKVRYCSRESLPALAAYYTLVAPLVPLMPPPSLYPLLRPITPTAPQALLFLRSLCSSPLRARLVLHQRPKPSFK